MLNGNINVKYKIQSILYTKFIIELIKKQIIILAKARKESSKEENKQTKKKKSLKVSNIVRLLFSSAEN